MPLHSGTTNSASRGDAVIAGWWTVNHRQAVDRLAGRTPVPAAVLVAAVPGLLRDERAFLVDLFEDRLLGSVGQLVRQRFGPFAAGMPELLDVIEPAGWATPPTPPAPPHPGVVTLTEERRRRRPIA